MERRSSQLTAAVTIRPAGRDDAAELRAIEVAAGENFRAIGMTEVADDPPPSVEDYRGAIGADPMWVAVSGGAALGYAWAADLDGQPHLEQVSVHPEHQGRGIGAALLERVAAWAAETGAGSLTLSTFRDVDFNGPWYGRNGFQVIPEGEWGARFQALRAHEVERGLDVEARVFMRRHVGPRPNRPPVP